MINKAVKTIAKKKKLELMWILINRNKEINSNKEINNLVIYYQLNL